MAPLIPRKFSRKLYLGNVWVKPLPGGTTIAATALNLSRNGLALFANQSLGIGQQVELVLRAGAAWRSSPWQIPTGTG